MFASWFPVDPDHTADRCFAVSQAEARDPAAHRSAKREAAVTRSARFGADGAMH
jgi:hypothetical protein